MARIGGVDLPNKKAVGIALTYIYGLGDTSVHEILTKVGIDPYLKTEQLSDQQIAG
ncbi:MAG: 30S ribosomal protein S13, partial [Deltaproteobacteria bacterium]|nr:30S ribosomal protein S13 [Deltaproteobacteria bacterium]